MKYLIPVILVLASLNIRADEPRFFDMFASANGNYKLVMSNAAEHESGVQQPEHWSLVDPNNSVKYEIKSIISDKRAFVSDDGNSVVVIDDFSVHKADSSLVVLEFFNKGKLTKEYSLGELLKDVQNITVSASHFRWFMQDKQYFKFNEQNLFITTYELRNYVFDIKTGSVLKNEIDKIIDGSTIYLYGIINQIDEEYCEIEIMTLVYGNVNGQKKIKFLKKNYIPDYPGNYRTIIIKNGEYMKSVDVMLNLCSYQSD